MDTKRAGEISKTVCDATTEAILYGNFGHLEDTAVNIENSMEGTLADVDCYRAEFDDRGVRTVFFHPIGKGAAADIADDFCEYVADLDDPPFDLIERTFGELEGRIAALPRGDEIDVPFYTEGVRGNPGLARVVVRKVACSEAVAEAKRMVREKASEIVCSCLAEGPGAMVRASSALGDGSGVLAAFCWKVSILEDDGNGGREEFSLFLPDRPWSGHGGDGNAGSIRKSVAAAINADADGIREIGDAKFDGLERGEKISFHFGFRGSRFTVDVEPVPCMDAIAESEGGRESPRP